MYDCRKCLRETMIRCIDRSPCLPEKKAEIWKAFVARQDTEAIRQFLQGYCILRQEDEEKTLQEKLVSSVREGRIGKGMGGTGNLLEVKRPAPPYGTRPLVIGQAEAVPGRPVDMTPLQALPEEKQPEPLEALPCSLIVVSTGHRISLPAEGELILGRIELDSDFLPDIDLASDTQGKPSISRRHAKIIASQGRHLIEDLGSTNGTAVNGRPLKPGQRIPLQPGDHVTLGLCEFIYRQTPRWLGIYRGRSERAFFWVTFSGNRYYLPPKPENILGRSDPESGITVDIDLSQEGWLVRKTSRRHVRVIEDGGLHFVEDLGSTYGTRLNGSFLEVGELVPLHPGDHLCLGSCVLYYDFEVQTEQKEGDDLSDM